MNRRDFLMLGAAAPLAAALVSQSKASVVQPDYDHEFLDYLRRIDSPISVQPTKYLPCFDFLNELSYPGVVGVIGEDQKSRTLVAHAIARKLYEKQSTILYDPWFMCDGKAPDVPVMTSWQNMWMIQRAELDNGLLVHYTRTTCRAQNCAAWYQELAAQCYDNKQAAVTVIPLDRKHFQPSHLRPEYQYFDNGTAYRLFCSFIVRVHGSKEFGGIVATVEKNRWDSGPARGDRLYFTKQSLLFPG